MLINFCVAVRKLLLNVHARLLSCKALWQLALQDIPLSGVLYFLVCSSFNWIGLNKFGIPWKMDPWPFGIPV